MSMTDPIADYLTKIRNALKAKKRYVDIPASNLKRDMSQILMEQGYLKDYINLDDGVQGILRLYLKYTPEGKSVISKLSRISRPGLRRYAASKDMPRVRSNIGMAIISTSKGVMNNKRAKAENVGGEVLCYVW